VLSVVSFRPFPPDFLSGICFVHNVMYTHTIVDDSLPSRLGMSLTRIETFYIMIDAEASAQFLNDRGRPALLLKQNTKADSDMGPSRALEPEPVDITLLGNRSSLCSVCQ